MYIYLYVDGINEKKKSRRRVYVRIQAPAQQTLPKHEMEGISDVYAAFSFEMIHTPLDPSHRGRLARE